MTNEEIKKAGEVMFAAANGKKIQVSPKDGVAWVDCRSEPAWDWSTCTYRIKPTKTLRPWKPEEVPLGAQTRAIRDRVTRLLIVGESIGGVWLAGEHAPYPFDGMLERREHSIDGGVTWKPCGVEVES